MSDDERVSALEETVYRLKIETTVLKAILGQQIALNNLNYKGKFDDVLTALAQEYAQRDAGERENQLIHDAIRDYIKYQPPSIE